MSSSYNVKDLSSYFKYNKCYKHISYRKYIVLIITMLDLDPTWFNISNMDKLCFEMAKLYEENIKKSSLHNLFDKRGLHGSFFRINYFNYLKQNMTGENNLTLINSPHNIKDYNDFFKSKYLVFDEENSDRKKFLDNLDKIILANKFINIEYTDDLFNYNGEKYNNVMTKLSFYMMTHFFGSFSLLKFPQYLYVTIAGIMRLKSGGDLFINIPHFKMNSAYKKLIILLSNLFEDLYVFNQKNEIFALGSIIHCKKYKDSLKKKNLDDLIKLYQKIKDYNYSFCDYLKYSYYISKKSPDTPIFYYIPQEDLPKNYKATVSKLNVVNDIIIPYKENYISTYIINKLESNYESFFTKINNILEVHVECKNNHAIIDSEYMEKFIYQRTNEILEVVENNNLPVSNIYLAYIKKYNKDIINKLFSLTHNIQYNIVKYDMNIDFIKKVKSYYYEDISIIEDSTGYYIDIRNKLLDKFPQRRLPPIVKSFTEDFARGVSNYINTRYNLDFKVSNAFTKLWEIYSTIPGIIKNKNKLSTFHIAEAPGQWINCTMFYVDQRKPKIKDVDWYGNTLNFKNKWVLKNFEPLRDTYGYIKNNPDNWLYGEDDTGDITNAKNIRWFRKFFENKPMDLVTGDGGTSSENLSILQKLDFSQLCLTLAVSKKDSNCVIKHFLPYIYGLDNSLYSNGFFVNYLYLYYMYFEETILVKPHTSSSNTGEFYVVGKKFKEISDYELEKLLKILEKFEENICFFEEGSIPEEFISQIKDFVKDIIKLNIDNFEMQTTLMTCLTEDNKIIKQTADCDKYLNKDYIEKIQDKRFSEWIKLVKF